jgi:hypothetical protein
MGHVFFERISLQLKYVVQNTSKCENLNILMSEFVRVVPNNFYFCALGLCSINMPHQTRITVH